MQRGVGNTQISENLKPSSVFCWTRWRLWLYAFPAKIVSTSLKCRLKRVCALWTDWTKRQNKIHRGSVLKLWSRISTTGEELDWDGKLRGWRTHFCCPGTLICSTCSCSASASLVSQCRCGSSPGICPPLHLHQPHSFSIFTGISPLPTCPPSCEPPEDGSAAEDQTLDQSCFCGVPQRLQPEHRPSDSL